MHPVLVSEFSYLLPTALAFALIVVTSVLYARFLKRQIGRFVTRNAADAREFVGSRRFYTIALCLGIVAIFLQVMLMDFCERRSRNTHGGSMMIPSEIQIVLIPITYCILYVLLFRQFFCVMANSSQASSEVKKFVIKDMFKTFFKCSLAPMAVYLLMDCLYWIK